MLSTLCLSTKSWINVARRLIGLASSARLFRLIRRALWMRSNANRVQAQQMETYPQAHRWLEKPSKLTTVSNTSKLNRPIPKWSRPQYNPCDHLQQSSSCSNHHCDDGATSGVSTGARWASGCFLLNRYGSGQWQFTTMTTIHIRAWGGGGVYYGGVLTMRAVSSG